MTKTQIYQYLAVTAFTAALMLAGMLSISILSSGENFKRSL